MFLENSFPLNGVYVLAKFENCCFSSWMENELEVCASGYEMKRRLLLGRKATTSLDSILKSRDITLPTKVHLVKLWFFQWSCMDVSWSTKKAECQRIDAFELGCWRRLLRVPQTARRSSWSILKEISPEYSLEGLMLKLKLPILWPPDVKN